MICRRLKVSWQELQDMPEDTVAVWEAIVNGESHAERARNAAANAGAAH